MIDMEYVFTFCNEVHLRIITENVISLFFHIFNIESVENKHFKFLHLNSFCRLYFAPVC